MHQLSKTNITQPIYGVSGTFGTVQIAAYDQAVIVQTIGRNYDVTGILHIDAAQVRLPIDAAYKLHRLLADAIVEAEEQPDLRQTCLWSDATTRTCMRGRVA